MLLTADHYKQFKGEIHPAIYNLELLSITELWHGMFFSKYMSNFGTTLGIRDRGKRFRSYENVDIFQTIQLKLVEP